MNLIENLRQAKSVFLDLSAQGDKPLRSPMKKKPTPRSKPKPDLRTTRIIASPCPSCGKIMDAATSCEGHVPNPKSFTVCVECGQILQFDQDLRLVNADEADLMTLALEQPKDFQFLVRLSDHYKPKVNFAFPEALAPDQKEVLAAPPPGKDDCPLCRALIMHDETASVPESASLAVINCAAGHFMVCDICHQILKLDPEQKRAWRITPDELRQLEKAHPFVAGLLHSLAKNSGKPCS
jgi:hypothetical protein